MDVILFSVQDFYESFDDTRTLQASWIQLTGLELHRRSKIYVRCALIGAEEIQTLLGKLGLRRWPYLQKAWRERIQGWAGRHHVKRGL